MKRALPILGCALSLALGAPAARAAFNDPLFIFTPSPGGQYGSPLPPPSGYLQGPCGLGVDSQGRFYVADYYHHAIDVYSGTADYASPSASGATGYIAQLANEDPLDGPCGVALDSSNDLYVNDFHRNVVKFGPSGGFSPGPLFDSAEPTGVAVGPSGHVFVDDRTSIAEYDSSGAEIERIGEGTLADGYGVAVSGYSGTAGYVYVPDAASGKVKVYDPATDTESPIEAIAGPPGGFVSLADSAVAVDDASGEVYAIDTLGPQYTEHPQATVYVFASTGAYEGRLKYNVIDGSPSGLAVDDSATSTQGRVYVTSGITTSASIYAYPPGAASAAAAPPVGLAATTGTSEPSASAAASPAAVSAASATPSLAPASASAASPATSSAAASASGSKRASARRRHHRHRAHRHKRTHQRRR